MCTSSKLHNFIHPSDEIQPEQDTYQSLALQFKTDDKEIRKVGGDVTVVLGFQDKNGDNLGAFWMTFQDSIRYLVPNCMPLFDWEKFPEDLPSDDVKIWTISFSPDRTKPRLTLECNGVPVLNLRLSEDNCRQWSDIWTTDMVGITLSVNQGLTLEGHIPEG